MDRPSCPRPPLSSSPTSTSSASTLVGTPIELHAENKLRKQTQRRDPDEDVESFLRGGRGRTPSPKLGAQLGKGYFGGDVELATEGDGDEGRHEDGESVVRSTSSYGYQPQRRRWTKVCLAVLGILFLASCGGAVLSGFLFAGIGEVGGLTGQWIAQGLVGFGSLTSLFYITLHIRASRIINELYDASTIPAAGFEHPLESQAVLTIRTAFLLWLAALPAISMGIFHGGRTILKLDLFISVCGFLCTAFLVFVVERMDSAFELPLFSPLPSPSSVSVSKAKDLVSLLQGKHDDLESGGAGGNLRGGKAHMQKKKDKRGKGSGASFSSDSFVSSSSFTWTTALSSSSGTSSGASSPTRVGEAPGQRVITVPAPAYGPRALQTGKSLGRVLTRLSVINAMVPPAAHHAVPPPTPPPPQGQGAAPGSPSRTRSALSTASTVASAAATRLTPIAAGVASTVSGRIQGGGQGNKAAAAAAPQPQQQQQTRAQQPQGYADDGTMPGGYYGGQGGGHSW